MKLAPDEGVKGADLKLQNSANTDQTAPSGAAWSWLMLLGQANVLLFDLILLCPSQQSISYVGTVFLG